MAGRNEVFVLWDLPEPNVVRLRRVRQDLEARYVRVTAPPSAPREGDGVAEGRATSSTSG